jgi:hypothetical protein
MESYLLFIPTDNRDFPQPVHFFLGDTSALKYIVSFRKLLVGAIVKGHLFELVVVKFTMQSVGLGWPHKGSTICPT